MRRLIPEIEELDLDEAYQGLTLSAEPPTTGPERAWVALGMVSSIDGAAAVSGLSGGLGGAADRVAFTRLRGACDAILVGAGTVRAEGYRSPIGNEARRTDRAARGLAPNPRLVIVTRSLDLSPELAVFADPEHRPMIVTHGRHDAADLAPFLPVADVVGVGADVVDLGSALGELAVRGLSRILCEGGPGLASSLHEQDLLDEVFVTVAPSLVGGAAPRIVAGGREVARPWDLVSLHEHEGELLLRYRRPRDGR